MFIFSLRLFVFSLDLLVVSLVVMCIRFPCSQAGLGAEGGVRWMCVFLRWLRFWGAERTHFWSVGGRAADRSGQQRAEIGAGL